MSKNQTWPLRWKDHWVQTRATYQSWWCRTPAEARRCVQGPGLTGPERRSDRSLRLKAVWISVEETLATFNWFLKRKRAYLLSSSLSPLNFPLVSLTAGQFPWEPFNLPFVKWGAVFCPVSKNLNHFPPPFISSLSRADNEFNGWIVGSERCSLVPVL